MPPVPAPGGPACPACAAPSLRLLAEAVRCHVPIQPGSRHGTDPVPAGIFYGLLPAGTGEQRCDWSVRFVTGLSPGGRIRHWGWARGRTLASALQAARDIQRAAAVPPPAGSPPHSTPRGDERNTP